MNKFCTKKLETISSEIFSSESLNLSFFDKEVRECVLSLDIFEDEDYSFETLDKYRYHNSFFILKIDKDYYLINTSHIDVYYSTLKPLRIVDYYVYQRKDKLKKIQKNIDESS